MPDNPIILDIQGEDGFTLDMQDSDGLDFDTEPFSKGDPGKSAYQVAVDNGFSGTEEEWLASLKGDKGDTGATGATGNGVASVALVSTVGLVNTYRMTFTDGTYVDIPITDGAKGDTGDAGATGNGIASVTLVSTVGKVNTYRITFTDGTYTDFAVTDGADGTTPTATVVKAGTTTTITITDGNGTTTATVNDGVTDYNDLSNKPTKLSDFTDDLGSSPTHTHSQYLTSYTETDPVFTASAAHGITSTNITNWNDKQDALTAGDGIDITTNIISNTQGIEYIVGTQAAATNAWTGVSKDSSLTTGKIIAYYLPYAGTSTAATLQLTMADGTTTAAIDIKRQGGSTVTTHFAVDNVIIMIYDGTYWKVSGYYYSDSNYVPTGYCTTAAATAAKVATCTYGYRDDPTYFPCVFRYANTATNATLQITSYANTASAIYVNGARTSSSNSFGRGVVLFLYYNNAYYCYNDGRFPIVVNGTVTSIQDQLALYTPTASLATVATSGSYSDLSGTPSLATVATSGSYNDLSDTPTIHNVPSGGSTDQVLAKSSGTDYAATWAYRAPIIQNSVTGTPASFTDGLGYPFDSIVVNVDPVQTTNSGKNLLPTAGLTLGTPSDTTFSNATARTFTVGTYISGLNTGNYYQVKTTAISVSENSITFTTSASAYGLGIPLTGLTVGQAYTISATKTDGNLGLAFYKSDGTFISGNKASSSASYYTTTVPSDTYYTVVLFGAKTNNVEATFTDIQLELGSSATSYEPYTSQTVYPISGQTEVNLWAESSYDTSAAATATISLGGTYYGGTLNINTGILTVNRAFIQLDGSSSITYKDSGSTSDADYPYYASFLISATSTANGYTNWLSSHGAVGDPGPSTIFKTYYYTASTIVVYVGTSSLCNSAALIQSYLQTQYNNGTPLQIVYELATPYTVDLSAQALSLNTLSGNNYVWADTGDTTVTYPADTKTYIDNAIAAVIALI